MGSSGSTNFGQPKQRADHNFENSKGSLICPTVSGSQSPSNGCYRTTIPINSAHNGCQCQHWEASKRVNGIGDVDAALTASAVHVVANAGECKYNGNGCLMCASIGVVRTASTPTPATANASTKCAHNCSTHSGIVTTNVEYTISEGVAELSKISSSRVVVNCENLHVAAQSNLKSERTSILSALPPLLTSSDLAPIVSNLSCFRNRSTAAAFQREFGQQTCSMTSSRQGSIYITPSNDIVPGSVSGLQRLADKKLNKGLAFTMKERQLLGIHGLLPSVVKNEAEQVDHCEMLINRLDNNLDKYMYLNLLSERNERLFYNVLSSNITEMMPIVYTPTVGLACQKYSLIYQMPKGLYININDKGHIYDVLKNWPEMDVRVIVVTDGERILGLGDLGANGMGIPVGKLHLYTVVGGVQPQYCLPITLDVGTNTDSVRDDPLYIGLRQKRVAREEYDEFVDEFMEAVVRRFGRRCLIQFEDFGNQNAFRFLTKYRDSYCMFNDDIQGTASVGVAGIFASLKITKTPLKDVTILSLGAGEAALGIVKLCLMAMMKDGLTEEEAKSRIWLMDSRGLIVKDRPSGGLNEEKLEYAQAFHPIDTLLEAVNTCKPNILIGASAVGGAFTQEVLEAMAAINQRPVIFALSNPTSKAECTAEQAYTHTGGKALFASGSPFPEFTYNNKTFYPGQGNNAYIFPAVGMAVLCTGMLTVPEEVFLIAARTLADQCTPGELERGSLYPSLNRIRNCSIAITKAIMDYACENNLATVQPRPKDMNQYIKSQMYQVYYSSSVPELYTS